MVRQRPGDQLRPLPMQGLLRVPGPPARPSIVTAAHGMHPAERIRLQLRGLLGVVPQRLGEQLWALPV